MAEIRVVPRGKVYRQMFDAQVKLSMAVHESRRRRAAEAGVPLQDSATPPPQPGFGTRAGTERSDDGRSWDRTCATEKEETLPDVVVAEKVGSDINERLRERRLTRHTQAMAELQRDLASVSESYETPLRETGENFLSKMSACDEIMEKLMQKIVNADVTYTLQDLHQLWDTIAEKSEDQKKWIMELDTVLGQHESDRTTKITAVLKKYSTLLEDISYMMPPDIHRLIDGEAMMINQAILANRRAVARLVLQATEKHLQKVLLLRLHWEDKVRDWTRLKVQASVDRFREFMNKPLIQQPRGVQDTLESMRAKQEHLSQRLQTTLQGVSSLVPPRCSRELVSEWHSSLSALNEQIDSLHIDSVEKIRLYYESTWQDCLTQIQISKEDFREYGLSAAQVNAIVKNELLPQMDQCQSRSEDQIQALHTASERLARRAAAVSRSLFRFMRGAAELWEVHTARLQRADRQLKVQLEEVRQAHQRENWKKEAHLDMMMDKLRQESSEETLKVTLGKVILLLEDIKNGYRSLHSAEVDSVECYPALILEEMHCYSSVVSMFFSVDETYRMDSEDLRRYFPSVKLDASGQMESRRPMDQSRTPATEYPQAPADMLPIEDGEGSEQGSSATLTRVFTTSRGNTYHASSRMFQWEGKGPSLPELGLLVYPSSFWEQLQDDVCVAFFNHLEEWNLTALTNAMDVVATKEEELRAELDLRLRLHETRVQSVERDVHHARAEELVLHQERVDRHCKAVLLSLSQSRTDLQDLLTQQRKQTEEFLTQVYSMEDKFSSATSSNILLKLHNGLQSQLEKHTSHIQMEHRHFREETERKMATLRQTNAQFIGSFRLSSAPRLFSEGGNFTPKEIALYHKQLEKLAKRMDSADEAIAIDAEENEFKCMQQAKDLTNKFQGRFQFLATDLTFLEKLHRVLTSTQVQIKSEVARSSMQKRRLCGMLVELQRMMDAHTRPGAAEAAVTEQDLMSYTWSVNKELSERFQYLHCSPEPVMADTAPLSPQRRPSSMSFSPSPDGLIQPSRVGVVSGKDAAVGVVQELMRMAKLKDRQESQAGTPQKGFHARSVAISQQQCALGSLPPLDTTWRKSPSTQRVKRFSKPTRFDKRFQVFGSRPVEQGVATFKGLIFNILWKANDQMLLVAEEFYKKEHGPVSRMERLPETFELCAEQVNRKLLLYCSQAQKNHRSYLQEFYVQLRDFEGHLAQVLEVVIAHLGTRHIKALDQDTTQIREHLKAVLQTHEDRKTEHNRRLSPPLSHPAFQEELETLLLAEEERQREETSAIQSTKQELQACVRRHGDEFVAAVASLTEKLLPQLDSLLTVDELQAEHTVSPTRAVVSALSPSLSPDPEVMQQTATTILLAKGSGDESIQMPKAFRSWPGLGYLQPASDPPLGEACRSYGANTTAKASLAHRKTVEASEAVYQRFQQRFQEELSRAKEEMEAQMRQAACWQVQWRDSTRALKHLHPQ
ncbi:coiled-coil domain-containing protein 180 isoform X2 [Brienomyrus brachyistius]|uniref:coiled-coil domain-containing protein 180 isoform X2 n=1 Tax=Brienomyrus brachyistius TaxID=42636 RepID=UPI0020B1F1EE|nr:coiled-coil domain-containing protein 180 isoform X2 [Brienomyrus brachyistius]